MKDRVKIGALIAYLLINHAFILDRAASVWGSGALALYLALWSFVVGCLVLTAYIENGVVRRLAAALLACSTLFIDSAERSLGEALRYESFFNLVSSAGFAGEAVTQYAVDIAYALAGALCLFTGVSLKPGRSLRLPALARAGAPLLCTGALTAMLYVRGGEGAGGLPGAFTSIAYGALYGYDTTFGAHVERAPVRLKPGVPKREDIVLIVDESVAPQYLDINHPRGVRSGLGEPRPGISIHNYGYAAAITNCSLGSNVTLRHGGTRSDYRRINASMPPIWDYARKAGLRTVYIDAQRTSGNLHNMMTEEERRSIDEFVQMAGTPVLDRDVAIAGMLARRLPNGVPEFILVNKVGGHFPVNDKFPDSFARHRPMLHRGKFTEVSDDGAKPFFNGSAEDWRRYRNSYRNALLWNVGEFFDRLLVKADLSNATLIYTSDHGQDLHETPRRGVNTHCSNDPNQEEGVAPLVVIEGAARPALNWEEHLAANRNRASHYQIFPTLLELMGYDPRAGEPIYGRPLTALSQDPHTFNIHFYARLGREPVWRKLDLERLSGPVAD